MTKEIENNKRNTKLMDMIRHAYQTVPLYVNIAEEKGMDIEQIRYDDLMVVDKSYYIDCGMSVLSSEYIGKYLQKKLIWGRTSGSSGKYGEVYWDEIEMRKSLFSLWCYRKKYYHILPSDRLCYFFTADIDVEEVYRKDNIMAFSRKCLYDSTLKEVYRQILDFNPVWMILQPSIAVLLCHIIQNDSLEIPQALRYIEFTGEYLEETVRKKTREIFQCAIANQYGTKEVNSIAFECPEGNMHCLSDNVFLESLGEKYNDELCVTTLQNRAMPLVRFNIGDRGKILSGKGCPCGNCNDILELKAGRNNDWIKSEDGSKIHAYAVMQVMNAINYETDGGIIQYQIIQKEYRQFYVMMVIDEMDEEFFMIQMVQERMKQCLGEDIEIVIHVYSKLLPLETTGKLACFVSEVK